MRKWLGWGWWFNHGYWPLLVPVISLALIPILIVSGPKQAKNTSPNDIFKVKFDYFGRSRFVVFIGGNASCAYWKFDTQRRSAWTLLPHSSIHVGNEYIDLRDIGNISYVKVKLDARSDCTSPNGTEFKGVH
ncbi:hypothetical protein [Deinococcus sp.]|uniref:hypothetical protein n=1 Tax=Deinococcus sp. TaxID=47478 RepID=UPI0025DEA8B0|nr:hypothetical protein [Deinococcus sp.]